ncbi:MAG: integrase [Verrucomicrobia bacterium]|nr:integrase [Verrucomicrobiota bacterium]
MDSKLISEGLRGPLRGPLPPPIATYLTQLEALHYQPSTLAQHRRVLEQLARWLAHRGDPWCELDEARLAQFARPHRPASPATPGALPAVLARFLAVAREFGYARPAPVPVRSASEQLVDAFARYLCEVRGCVASTVQAYQRVAHTFVAETLGPRAGGLGRLRLPQVLAFVQRHLRAPRRTSTHTLPTALRSFLRFLHGRGALPCDLAAAVPRVPLWSLASLPAPLPAGAVAAVLAHCDRSTAAGQRDYAILLLVARLGLRSCEVCRLRLDDLDWIRGCLHVRAGKSARAAELPLSTEVGQALALYLERARPRGGCREVFVRACAPRVGLTRGAIYRITRAAFARAGRTGGRQGAHLLRHTLATELLRRGASLDEIAEILRHRDPSTTALYAKVDVKMLRTVAMPWPGGAR